mmetsp:Transcript_12210/g.45275  ORF Transcript_12210/g.45275 Transcript_12210/m.45275 type:complete len:224 (+) Transcript_12210:1342-2013(+)
MGWRQLRPGAPVPALTAHGHARHGEGARQRRSHHRRDCSAHSRPSGCEPRRGLCSWRPTRPPYVLASAGFGVGFLHDLRNLQRAAWKHSARDELAGPNPRASRSRGLHPAPTWVAQTVVCIGGAPAKLDGQLLRALRHACLADRAANMRQGAPRERSLHSLLRRDRSRARFRRVLRAFLRCSNPGAMCAREGSSPGVPRDRREPDWDSCGEDSGGNVRSSLRK